ISKRDWSSDVCSSDLNRPMAEPEYLRDAQMLDLNTLVVNGDQNAALRALLGSPTISSKRWVYRQYDHMVRTNTINLPGMGAGVEIGRASCRERGGTRW